MASKQERRWQDKIITYGCLVRLFFISAMVILIVAAAIVFILHIGGEAWSTASAGVLAGLGALIGVLQWLYPLAPIDDESFYPASSTREQAYNVLHKREENLLQNDGHNLGTTGTLIVLATQEHRGKRVYLLPRHLWHQTSSSSVRDKSNEKIYAIVTRRRINNYPIYVAIFRYLKQGKYIVWTTYGMEHPKNDAVEVFPADISEFELTWLE